MGASGTGTSGQADTAEEVGLDRTNPQEASIQHNTPSPDLEPAGEEKERPASQSWRRDTEAELKQQGTNWSGMTRASQNKVRWRGVVDGLCSTSSSSSSSKMLYYLFREIYPWCHRITENSTFYKTTIKKSILIKTRTPVNTINMELPPPPFHTHTHTQMHNHH